MQPDTLLANGFAFQKDLQHILPKRYEDSFRTPIPATDPRFQISPAFYSTPPFCSSSTSIRRKSPRIAIQPATMAGKTENTLVVYNPDLTIF